MNNDSMKQNINQCDIDVEEVFFFPAVPCGDFGEVRNSFTGLKLHKLDSINRF